MAKRALIIIDLQNGVCRGTEELFGLTSLLEKVNQRIEQYRQQNLPIIFIQHNDSDLPRGSNAWQLVPELQNAATDYYVDKTRANSFYQTNFQVLLNELAITELEILGAQVEYCVDSTIKFAHGSGYPIFLHHNGASTVDNSTMSAEETIHFYENIWCDRFATFLDS